jgi:membrane protease YdiL (CAAX protease family)
MSGCHVTNDARRRPGALAQLAAAAIGLAPVAVLVIFMRLTRDQPFEARDLLVYPLVFGGGTIVLITLLQRLVCGERLRHLNLSSSAWWGDVLWGLVLFAVFAVLAVVQRFTVAQWFPREPAPEIANLIAEMSESPLLMALWLGPVVWMGVAAFEELARVFLLSRLWLVWPSRASRWRAVVLTAVLFGLAHMYQGTAGVIATAIMGFIAGWFYLARGRVWPLIISHALYDSAWIIFGVAMIRGGMQ